MQEFGPSEWSDQAFPGDFGTANAKQIATRHVTRYSEELVMRRTLHSPIRKRTISVRPHRGADRANPFGHVGGRETAKPEPHRAPRGPSLEIQRQALLALRARLRGDVAQTAGSALGGSIAATSASPDTADCASEITEQDLAVRLLGSATGTLEQIEAALQRMEDGSYGRCANCDVKIPAARLKAIPYASCCVACAARQERAA